MDLKAFAKTYSELENKAIQIMDIYGIGQYELEGIEVEEHQNKLLINIKSSIYYSGCGTETEWLSFELEEMNNDITYFKEKREMEMKVIAEKKAEKRKAEDKTKENRERINYERLKKKFETK